MEIRLLKPHEYHLIDHFFDREGVPRLDPNFSKVVVAIDGDKVAGIMAAQMVLHVEPIIIEPEYRKQGIWKPMTEMLDGYLQATGVPGVYAQPLHPSTIHMCETLGFKEMENKLFLKVYAPGVETLVANGGE